MSMFDTVVGLKVKCPICKHALECFQTKSFLCWNKRIYVKDMEEAAEKWCDNCYKCYCICPNCQKDHPFRGAYDLVYDKGKYTLYKIAEKTWEYENEYQVEVEYESKQE